MFISKADQAGDVVQAKARLVMMGYSAVESVDYLEIFAPTPPIASIRILTGFTCEKDLDVYHFDAEQAFVQSEFNKEFS